MDQSGFLRRGTKGFQHFHWGISVGSPGPVNKVRAAQLESLLALKIWTGFLARHRLMGVAG